MKSNGNHGSKVPLNLAERPGLTAQPLVVKSDPFRQAEQIARAGTPPTRWGMFNGTIPATRPNVPAELNPPLVVKAVRDPAMAATVTGGDAAPRKRDGNGKFTQAQSAGPQSTSEDDMNAQHRTARLAEQRYLKALGVPEMPPATPPGGGGAPGAGGGGAPGAGGAQAPSLARPKPNPMQQAGIPSGPPGQQGPAGGMGGAAGAGMPGGAGAGGAGMMPLGQTPDGLPVFDDPFNPAHQSFTPEQHKAAADLHNQQAEMATASGRVPTALDHQLKARIHLDLGKESQSPSQRGLARQGMPGDAQGDPNGMPGAMGAGGGAVNPMDDFLTQMADKDPNAKNTMGGPGAGGPDQQKPNPGGVVPNTGPMPRMMNTHTGGPVGPQSQSGQHAGTVEQPQMMPPEPGPGQGSMPDIQGPQDGGGMPGEMPTTPFSWQPEDFDDPEDAGQAGGGMPGAGGAQEAPPSHGGAVTQPGPEEGEMPTPGAGESEPPLDAGPSTNDTNPMATEKKPPSADANPFSGNPTEEKADEEAMKSFFDTL
jgi:collagen type III alpha